VPMTTSQVTALNTMPVPMPTAVPLPRTDVAAAFPGRPFVR
jgi:hypothetical protein